MVIIIFYYSILVKKTLKARPRQMSDCPLRLTPMDDGKGKGNYTFNVSQEPISTQELVVPFRNSKLIQSLRYLTSFFSHQHQRFSQKHVSEYLIEGTHKHFNKTNSETWTISFPISHSGSVAILRSCYHSQNPFVVF